MGIHLHTIESPYVSGRELGILSVRYSLLAILQEISSQYRKDIAKHLMINEEYLTGS